MTKTYTNTKHIKICEILFDLMEDTELMYYLRLNCGDSRMRFSILNRHAEKFYKEESFPERFNPDWDYLERIISYSEDLTEQIKKQNIY